MARRLRIAVGALAAVLIAAQGFWIDRTNPPIEQDVAAGCWAPGRPPRAAGSGPAGLLVAAPQRGALGSRHLMSERRFVNDLEPAITGRTGGSSCRRRAHEGRTRDVLVADLGDIEALEALGELPERDLEGREGLAGARQRRRAGQDEVLHVGVVDAPPLELGDHAGQHLVGLAHHAGTLLALLERLRQRPLEETVDPPQDRRERAAGEAR